MKMRGLTKGIGGSAVDGLVGVVAFYAHRMLSSKVAFVQSKPLVAPAGMFVLGHILKVKGKKLAPVGAALVGISGYAGAQVFELQKASTAAAAPAKTTSGFDDDDTGALTAAADIGALTAASDIGGMYPQTASSAYANTSGFEDAEDLSL